MESQFQIEKLKTIETPYYYYDVELLTNTLNKINSLIANKSVQVHYAIKANFNKKILSIISSKGFGADCVSKGEIQEALENGFPNSKILFAGVGKTDKEIGYAIDHEIYCFNVESIPELEVINQTAKEKGKIVNISFRVNPNIQAHTHSKITTGLNENKFGIALRDIYNIIELVCDNKTYQNVKFIGLHFHIGSQILDLHDFLPLCALINDMNEKLRAKQIYPTFIDVGGGLGIDYESPNSHPIPNFEEYFATYLEHIKLYPGQVLHCELGRAIVAQCGNLISQVTYIKEGETKKFAILDAGMTELIRPAMYGAVHQIEKIKNSNDIVNKREKYDVVGPICESSDVFAKGVELEVLKRGDLVAIRSAGAYGESMASNYNCRGLVKGYLSTEL